MGGDQGGGAWGKQEKGSVDGFGCELGVADEVRSDIRSIPKTRLQELG